MREVEGYELEGWVHVGASLVSDYVLYDNLIRSGEVLLPLASSVGLRFFSAWRIQEKSTEYNENLLENVGVGMDKDSEVNIGYTTNF